MKPNKLMLALEKPKKAGIEASKYGKANKKKTVKKSMKKC